MIKIFLIIKLILKFILLIIFLPLFLIWVFVKLMIYKITLRRHFIKFGMTKQDSKVFIKAIKPFDFIKFN